MVVYIFMKILIQLFQSQIQNVMNQTILFLLGHANLRRRCSQGYGEQVKLGHHVNHHPTRGRRGALDWQGYV